MEISKNAKITIGIPVYNGEKFLEKQLESIINLGYDDFELIISDNGSTDNTKKICEKFASKDKRVKSFFHTKNLGPNWNFNYILRKAKGEYFMWLSVDDKILPGFIEKNISVLETKEYVICSISQVKPYGEKTEYLVENETDKIFIKIKKKIIRYFTPLKNISTNGPYEKKIRLYLKLRGHQHVFYGIYRTEQLKKIFVSEFLTGFDLATMLNGLKFGDFFVLDEILNYRYDGGDSSDGFFNYIEIFKMSFLESISVYYPLTKWCWNNLSHKTFLRNLDLIFKLNTQMIFFMMIDIIRKVGLGVLVNSKKR